MNRRKLITGLIAFAAAPAIVKASNLMPIRGDRYFVWEWRCPILPAIHPGAARPVDTAGCFGPNGRLNEGIWTFFGKDRNIYSDEQIAFRKQEYPVALAA